MSVGAWQREGKVRCDGPPPLAGSLLGQRVCEGLCLAVAIRSPSSWGVEVRWPRFHEATFRCRVLCLGGVTGYRRPASGLALCFALGLS